MRQINPLSIPLFVDPLEPDRKPPLLWSHDPIHWLRLGTAGRMGDVPAAGNGDVAVHLCLHGIEVDDVIVFARDSLEHAPLRIGEQRLAQRSVVDVAWANIPPSDGVKSGR